VSLIIASVLAGVLVPAEAPSVADFRAACAAKAQEAEKADAIGVVGKDDWLFLGKDLRHVGVGTFWGDDAKKVSKATSAKNADPLPAILDFKAQLDKAGIELLLVPVPPKPVVYADKILDKAGTKRLDASHQKFYALLRKQGVKVLDLTDDLIALRGNKAGEPYCKTDSHWSGVACELAARRITAELKSRPWIAPIPRLTLTSESKRTKVEGDLSKLMKGDKEETLPLRFIGTKKGEELTPLEPSRANPIVLLGDSHNLVFHSGGDMLARGAGLPDQLALELGFAVDLVAVRGSGATPARVNLLRLARADKKYLGGKKLVIWCFSAREFTESTGWQKVPVVK
jgi:SGNH hydrolase-like domain, acetyltransferase AlgX